MHKQKLPPSNPACLRPPIWRCSPYPRSTEVNRIRSLSLVPLKDMIRPMLLAACAYLALVVAFNFFNAIGAAPGAQCLAKAEKLKARH